MSVIFKPVMLFKMTELMKRCQKEGQQQAVKHFLTFIVWELALKFMSLFDFFRKVELKSTLLFWLLFSFSLLFHQNHLSLVMNHQNRPLKIQPFL
jgi:hypothetical protein